MATTVKEYVAERGIRTLVHFTRESNLDSILERGLITRDTLVLEGKTDFNDDVRADHTNAVCLSIGFPNYKMWYGIKQDNPGVDWVILAVNPEVLWTLPCAFCAANAALGAVAAIPVEQRMSLEAFQAMYAEVQGKERVKLGISNGLPSNPQAEVLMLQGVPRSYILSVIAQNLGQQKRLQAKYPGLDVVIKSNYFSYRSDWQYWKPGV